MCHTDRRFGASWDDWSEEKELARKAWHDDWLKRTSTITAPRKYVWGRVASSYDERSADSSIEVTYAGRSRSTRA